MTVSSPWGLWVLVARPSACSAARSSQQQRVDFVLGVMISTMAIDSGQQRVGAFDPVDSRLAGRVLTFGGCAALGAGTVAAWLGRDFAPTDTSTDTTSTVALVGCAVSVAVVTAVLARWRNPLVVAGGTTFGSWALCTAYLGGDPVASGPLWAVGSAIVLLALVMITVVAAGTGYAWRRWRAPAPARPAPGLPEDLWRTGTAVVVVGGCWLLIGAVARQAYPLAWNYLTILHLPLDVLVAAAMAAGVVMAVDSGRRRRALGLSLRRLAPSAALGVVLVLAVIVGRALPAGDGFNGQVGVMAGPDGSPVAVLGLCQGTVDSLVIEDLVAEQAWQEGDDYAPAASLEHDGGLGGVVQVDLTDPPAQWSGAALGEPASGEDELNITATGRQSLLNDTYFTRAEIQALEPGMVVYSVWEQPDGPYTGNEQVPLADFADLACTNPGRNG